MPAGCRARTPSAEFTALQLQFIPFLRLACTPLATVCSGQGLGEAKNNHFTSYYSYYGCELKTAQFSIVKKKLEPEL
jgi:hypothetical protein